MKTSLKKEVIIGKNRIEKDVNLKYILSQSDLVGTICLRMNNGV